MQYYLIICAAENLYYVYFMGQSALQIPFQVVEGGTLLNVRTTDLGVAVDCMYV